MFLLLVLLFSHIQTWDLRIHRAILLNALSSLNPYVHEDLELRLSFFKDMGLKVDSTSIVTIPDLLRPNNFMFLAHYHYFPMFTFKESAEATEAPVVTYIEENRLFELLSQLNQYLLKDKRIIYFDKFSLMYLTHIAGDMFQPFHSLTENGLKTPVEGYRHLHDYWDLACGYFSKKSVEEMSKELHEIETKGFFEINGVKTTLTHLNKFKANMELKEAFEELKDIYSESVKKEFEFNALKDRNRLLIEAISDTSEVTTAKYKNFCQHVALQNMVYSSLFLRNLLNEIYINLKPSLDNSQTNYLIKMNNLTGFTINYNYIFQTIIIILLLVNIFLVGLIYLKSRKDKHKFERMD